MEKYLSKHLFKTFSRFNTILYLSVGQIPFPFCIKSPLLTSWSTLPLEKLTLAHLIKLFSGFHDPEGSLPLSQKPTIGPYPKTDGYNPHPSISTSGFNILPSTPRSCRLSPYFGFPTKTVYTVIFCHARHITCQIHPWFEHPNHV